MLRSGLSAKVRS